jgi:hemerythrin superfamily protein
VDGLTLLKNDHDEVKSLMERVAATTDRAIKTREETFGKIHQALQIHEAIEEEILYPALKEHPDLKDLALEAYEEHHVVDRIMGEILQIPVDDERWMAKFTVMKENLEHHIEEEEGEMFKQARQAFDKDQLEDLGARMERRKAELERSASAA